MPSQSCSLYIYKPNKPTDYVGVTVKTAVDLSSKFIPEAVFYRWPLVNENGARNNIIVNLMINKLR